jgi:hypothetical protein
MQMSNGLLSISQKTRPFAMKSFSFSCKAFLIMNIYLKMDLILALTFTIVKN